MEAMEMAVRRRKPAFPLIAHSDRGSQYCSKEYQKILKKNKIICSMSKKGDCYDNACAETFFHSFKVEWIFDKIFKSYEECKESATEYIEIFYNRHRLHSYLGYKTPYEFEKAFYIRDWILQHISPWVFSFSVYHFVLLGLKY